MIEDALRETFAAHAVQGPQDVVGDRARGRAESAILRAGRIRRRRTISTALASVLVVAIVSLAMFQAVISRSSPSDPTLNAAGDLDPTATGVAPQPSSGQFPSTVTDTPMPIEMASDGEIYKEDKTTLHLTLPAKSEPRWIYKATDVYLVVVTLDTTAQQLLQIDRRGNQKVLLSAAQQIVVSPSGDQVAWLADNTLSVAFRRANHPALDDQRKIPAPAQSTPVAFIGTNVVLGRTKADGTGSDGFDLWYTDHDSYVESWDPRVLRILGPRSDGKALYAQIRTDADAVCLALLLPAQPFTVTNQRCGLPEPASVAGGISPDGRWLAYPVAGAAQVAILDLSGFSGTPKPRLVDLKASCDRVFWVGDSSLVVDAAGQFTAIDPRQPGNQETAQGKSDGTVPIEPLRASIN